MRKVEDILFALLYSEISNKSAESIKNQIKILLIEDIEQGDAIRFKNHNKGMYINYIYDESNKLINKAI